jgi:glycosyltransferase involved in cell wall biosynthesis
VTAGRRLKVAIVIDSWDDAANGAVISTRRFTDLLRSEGHTVTVLATGEPAPGKVVLRPFYIPFANDIMRKMRLPFAWPTAAVLDPTIAEQDLVHVQFPFYLGIKAIATARRLGKPVVSTFHVQAEHLLYNIGVRNQALVEQVYRLFLRSIYNRSDHVVCPSNFAERELTSRGLTAPTTVISNGVPPEFRPVPPGGAPDFGGKFVLLSVGRLAREKRHELVIDAVRHSRHRDRIQLIILGDGPLRETLEEKGAGLPNPPVFKFLKKEELIHWYGAGDLCVHASEVEVECMSVLEAQACGLPCLIANSSRSATPQFALSADYLFQSGDMADLVQKLDMLVDDPARLSADRAASQKAAAAYSIELSFEKLLQVYRQVVPG